MKVITFLSIILFLISCGEPGNQKDRYDIRQKLYSNQGVDSVETTLFYYKKDSWVGRRIFNSKNPASEDISTLNQAERFIEKHEKFNK